VKRHTGHNLRSIADLKIKNIPRRKIPFSSIRARARHQLLFDSVYCCGINFQTFGFGSTEGARNASEQIDRTGLVYSHGDVRNGRIGARRDANIRQQYRQRRQCKFGLLGNGPVRKFRHGPDADQIRR
jgi:hypothetical protein